jgi:hypothetical protein
VQVFVLLLDLPWDGNRSFEGANQGNWIILIVYLDGKNKRKLGKNVAISGVDNDAIIARSVVEFRTTSELVSHHFPSNF